MRSALLFLCLWLNQQIQAQNNSGYQFEKIIYHTSVCFGTCPVYHMEITKTGQVKLQLEMAYKRGPQGQPEPDKTRIGFYTGKISVQKLNQLITAIQGAGLDTLKISQDQCCDGSMRTVIVYHNGLRTEHAAMFEPEELVNLFTMLREICNPAVFKRTNNKLKIEAPKGDEQHRE